MNQKETTKLVSTVYAGTKLENLIVSLFRYTLKSPSTHNLHERSSYAYTYV